MVLSAFSRKAADPYLVQTVQTERFDLIPSNWRRTYKLTLPLASDAKALQALMFGRTSYSRLQWASRVAIPNGRSVFAHAIMPKGSDEAIGVHIISLTRSGTATLMIAVTSETWWGKGVFEEVRAGLLDHFSSSPRIVRFYGQVLARNFASVYNYKKLGFRLIGFERKAWRSPLTGELLDTMSFEYLSEDWRADRQLGLV